VARLSIFACAFVLSTVLVSISIAAKNANVTGTWAAEVDINGAVGMPEFTFKQDGDKITGKYKGQFGGADVTGKVKGNEIEFSFDIMGEAKVTYTGTIEKDGTMKGKADYAGQASGTWTAKKKPAN
jgi:hypothetical protein